MRNSPVPNPLERWNQLGTSWFGVVCEIEGVLMSDFDELQRLAWRQLALEEGLECPVEFDMRYYTNFKSDQLVSQVFRWTHKKAELSRLLNRKQQILYDEIQSTQSEYVKPAALNFFNLMSSLNIPCVFVTQDRRSDVQRLLKGSNLGAPLLASLFQSNESNSRATLHLISSEDVKYGLPDTETLTLASFLLERPLERIVVIGSSLQALEAACELNMPTLMVSGRHKAWELKRASLVVHSLNDLSFQNMRNLFHHV